MLQLVELMSNDFMSRMTGNTARDVEAELDPAKGDIGLFASHLRFIVKQN